MSKKIKVIDKELPVVDWYDGLPKHYQDLVSQQALALLQKEGITNDRIEGDLAHRASSTTEWALLQAAFGAAIQSRDLLAQILLEVRETNVLLREIIKLAGK